MCIGRGGVVTAQRRRSTVANWGCSSFRPSSARTAPFCVAITTATFLESRLSYAPCFFVPCCVLVRRPAACTVHMAERPRGMAPDAASERRYRRDALLPPIVWSPSLTQVPDRGRAARVTAISTSGHPALRRTRTGCPLDAKRCKWHVAGVRCAAPIGTNEI